MKRVQNEKVPNQIQKELKNIDFDNNDNSILLQSAFVRNESLDHLTQKSSDAVSMAIFSPKKFVKVKNAMQGVIINDSTSKLYNMTS